MPFPATGPYKTHFGMFVGEVHDERETMEVLIQKMRILAGSVDVRHRQTEIGRAHV